MLLLALGVLLSACFEANLQLEVRPSGSVTQTLTLTQPQEVLNGELFSDFIKHLQSQGWQVRREEIQTIATRTLENVHDTGLGTGAFLEERFRLTRRGWLMESYLLEASLGQPNPIFSGLLPASQILSLFTRDLQPKLSLSLLTPLTASQHNADKVEGRRYTWQIRLDRANHYHIEYRVLRWDRVAAIMLGVGLLVLGGRFWYARRRSRKLL
ncbi:hypothetical protein [Meiothermus hypogaeus]|uniref:DUF3153 domain-containing protein n=2 Tax=Meiothermus hypogaeus TaxID=884155 RepID=A0A511R4H3_9DEIN|nr:hypothetical protein [Meiothermus hypogaeus]RIH80183.1 hypothetical protein Mhypo_00807 [Meiothermus hypogaeus]GEM84510.1 hypothetical protein MHY01S_26760 [Meiothermus hypogaeus NBRC 106114]